MIYRQWLEADLKSGISNTDVETRRKRTGFNELVRSSRFKHTFVSHY